MHEQEVILGEQINTAETEQIEVALVSDEKTARLELRLLTWSEGIGWYVQKRIPLDDLQSRFVRICLEQGERLLQSASPPALRTEKISSLVAEHSPGAQVIPFPMRGIPARVVQ